MPLNMYKGPESKKTPETTVKSVIAVAAGKGGVGKSSVTVNLARAMQELGLKVRVLDTDLYGPSLRQMMPEQTPPRNEGEKIYPAISHGIPLVSMAFFREEDKPSVVRAPIANSIISQFVQNVEWGDLDFLLIDFPPGTGDIQLSLGQQAHIDAALIVTTPQDLAMIDVRKAIGMFDLIKVPVLGVVENMSFYQKDETSEKVFLFGSGGGAKLSGECGVPLMAQIPLDPQIGRCADKGLSLFDECEDHLCAHEYLSLAESVNRELDVLRSNHKQNSLQIEIDGQDSYHIGLKWADGFTAVLRYSDLQSQCPCANCVDEWTGVRKDVVVDKSLTARAVHQVGRYGLRLEFSSGCQSGIFSYSYLRELVESKQPCV